MEAKIVLGYEDRKAAEAVAKAVSPDNFKTPKGLKIKTVQEEGKVITTIRCGITLPTFIATIDDLLFCTSVAEKALRTIKKC